MRPQINMCPFSTKPSSPVRKNFSLLLPPASVAMKTSSDNSCRPQYPHATLSERNQISPATPSETSRLVTVSTMRRSTCQCAIQKAQVRIFGRDTHTSL